jgi:beta-mannosidase
MGGTTEEWKRYWENDDALFRSEAGCPGASSADIIERYKGDLPVMPCSLDNPLWKRTSWWVEWDVFLKELGREPKSLQEYVEWSQRRQAEALKIAANSSKRRFPGIGGFIIWMGHDSFPCTANTSIIDFDGNPNPAALAVAEVFRKQKTC